MINQHLSNLRAFYGWPISNPIYLIPPPPFIIIGKYLTTLFSNPNLDKPIKRKPKNRTCGKSTFQAMIIGFIYFLRAFHQLSNQNYPSLQPAKPYRGQCQAMQNGQFLIKWLDMPAIINRGVGCLSRCREPRGWVDRRVGRTTCCFQLLGRTTCYYPHPTLFLEVYQMARLYLCQ